MFSRKWHCWIGTLTIASTLMLRATTAVGCSLPLESKNGSWIVSVRIGGEGPFRFLLDTGSTVTVISSELAKRLNLLPDRALSAMSTTGELPVSGATVSNLQAGKIEIPELPVLIASLPHEPA